MREDLAEEIGHLLPLGISGFARLRLHDGYEAGQSDGQGHLEVVIYRRDTKLPPGEVEGI